MKRNAVFLAAIPLIFTAGCANESLFFGTKTSIGIDISATAGSPSANLGYERTEIAIVPPKQDGNAHDVLGGIDADLSLANGVRIKELFATGRAARLAAGKADTQNSRSGSTNGPANQGEQGNGQNATTEEKYRQPIVFAADASFSLLNIKIQGNGLPTSGSTLYRRSEVTLIPVKPDQDEVASVYADISIDTADKDSLKTEGENAPSRVGDAVGDFPSSFKSGGVRIVQNFATGQAAEQLAEHDEQIKTKLQNVVKGVSNAAPSVAKAMAALRTKLNNEQDSGRILAFFKWMQDTYPRSKASDYTAGKAGDYFIKRIEPRLTDEQKLDVSNKADEMLK